MKELETGTDPSFSSVLVCETMYRSCSVGIRIHSEITVHGFDGEIYAALTGDQCTLTSIRITRGPAQKRPAL